MRKLSTLTFAVIAGLSAQYVSAAQLMSVDDSRAIEGKYIVVFKTPSVLDIHSHDAISNFASLQAKSLVNLYNIEIAQEFGNVLNGVLVNASSKQIKQMLSDPNIEYIEQDQIMSISPLASTNENQANAVWGLDRIDQQDLPLNGNYSYEYDGSGVTAYVIDTGVRVTHNEFGNRASHGYDFIDNDNDATDCNGHGTHVAGTIGGGTYGVAKNVNIVGVRVLGCSGSGSNSGVIAGINWVKNNASGPSVANMSLGGGVSQATDDAVNNAVASGVNFIVAAGNDNSNACNYSPARAANAITVGSTTSNDGRSSFSNYGNCLDIYAPGSNIKSAWYNSDSATNSISGTSMASPHVAGAVALYLDQNPSLSTSQIESLLSQRSSKNKVSDAKSGSPNELLHTLEGIIVPPPKDKELINGQGVTASGTQGSNTFYKLVVPAGSSSLSFNTSGGSGDVDLYVQVGQKPSINNYNCRPFQNGNVESCTFNNPQAGDWWVMLNGYSQYNGVNLVGNYEADGGCGSNCLTNGVPATNIAGASGQEVVYTIDVPANVALNVAMSGGSGDADLYVRRGAKATTSTYDCRPFLNGNNESCNVNSGQGGKYYITLRGYNSFSGVSVVASY
ncbi:S8 family peptidase [Pseudoalteromonas tunicata]|jgi:serine protease|uniref:Alkaline serine protease n=1 Tax=Pseudoalteromonas tunicata D2 TaxID=87626 RepID=A4C3J1_9GAMM|nr:S8 family peptidase [Pseudoalteromonas tunicata]ATC96595.1 serine protease [Pseudoalteromonas tunicata]AXT32780.1 S8 family peptidase [Pseudoalteromonas tunicata]EAR30123.1 alkaline serine protease [Pseudoalteromonas tunicata D2]MDP5214518.1 S8 family peptidase [Pseudoalteromonas tunicata]